MIPGYSGCEKCPLRDCPPVLGSGSDKASLVVIGEAPGATEVLQGRPFVGKSGQLLDRTLGSLGVERESIYATNACLCRPPDNATPPKEAIAACQDRLRQEVEKINPVKILLLGGTATTSILSTDGKPVSVSKVRGLGQMVDLGSGLKRFAVATYHPAYVLRDLDTYRDFAGDIVKWLSQSEPLPQPDLEVIIPATFEEVRDGFSTLANASVIGCDIESTGFDFLKDQILSIGFGAIYDTERHRGISMIIPIALANQPDVKSLIIRVLRFHESTLVFHNGKFDLQFFMAWANNYDLWPKVFADTMLMQYAQDERGSGGGGRGYRTLGLKEQSRIRYDIPDYHFDFKKFFALDESDRPYDDLYRYQAIDTCITARLFFDLYDELIEESPTLWDVTCQKLLFPGARALARMEYNGFPIDTEYFQSKSAELHAQVDSLVARLTATAESWGFPTFKPGYAIGVRKVWESRGFSPPKGAEREVILLALREVQDPDTVAFVEGILEYRQISKLLSTYIDGALKHVGDDGRIRSDFMLTGSDTGRLASRDPNLQNIPTLVGPIVRRGYIAPEGWTLAEIDYSQLELRIAAFYSRDVEMIRAYREGLDIHKIVASNMFKKPIDDITYLERYMAKYVDFGIIYGRSAPSLASGWEMEYIVEQGGTAWTVPEAEIFLREFLDGFPQLRDWIKHQHTKITKLRYTETPTGRRRRFPYLDRVNIGNVQRQSVNTPIQSLASDICLYNVIALTEKLPRDEAQVVSTVHDAIYVLIRNDVLAKWLPFCIRTMETNLPIPIDVPIKVEAEIGTRWGELKDPPEELLALV